MKLMMKSAWNFSRGLSLLGLLLLVMALPAQAAQGPLSQVEQSVNQILEILRNDDVQGDERREQLSDLIRQRFDFKTMAQYVLGPQWRKTSLADKDQFTKLFSDLLEASYIGKIEAYTDEEVTFAKEQIEGRKAKVGTLILTGTTEIPIDYRLVSNNDAWLVYDVIIEGVSLVRTYRDNYREIVRKKGMAELLVRMEDKLAEIRQDDTAG